MVVYRVITYNDDRYGIAASVDDKVIESAELEGVGELDVTKLALLCNQEQLSPVHLKDVVEDTLYRLDHKIKE